jgi:hypothetical protein
MGSKLDSTAASGLRGEPGGRGRDKRFDAGFERRMDYGCEARVVQVHRSSSASISAGFVVEACSWRPSISKTIRSKKRMVDSSSTTKILST